MHREWSVKEKTGTLPRSVDHLLVFNLITQSSGFSTAKLERLTRETMTAENLPRKVNGPVLAAAATLGLTTYLKSLPTLR